MMVETVERRFGSGHAMKARERKLSLRAQAS